MHEVALLCCLLLTDAQGSRVTRAGSVRIIQLQLYKGDKMGVGEEATHKSDLFGKKLLLLLSSS